MAWQLQERPNARPVVLCGCAAAVLLIGCAGTLERSDEGPRLQRQLNRVELALSTAEGSQLTALCLEYNMVCERSIAFCLEAEAAGQLAAFSSLCDDISGRCRRTVARYCAVGSGEADDGALGGDGDVRRSDAGAPPVEPSFQPVFTRSGRFDGGARDAVVIPHEATFEIERGTIELVLTADALPARVGLLGKDATGYGEGGHLSVLLESGKVAIRSQDRATESWLRGQQPLQAGQRHHLALVFAPGGSVLYLDGAAIANVDRSLGLSTNREPLVIGANAWASAPLAASPLSDFFAGEMTVAIYSDALTAQQVAALANVRLEGTPRTPGAPSDPTPVDPTDPQDPNPTDPGPTDPDPTGPNPGAPTTPGPGIGLEPIDPGDRDFGRIVSGYRQGGVVVLPDGKYTISDRTVAERSDYLVVVAETPGKVEVVRAVSAVGQTDQYFKNLNKTIFVGIRFDSVSLRIDGGHDVYLLYTQHTYPIDAHPDPTMKYCGAGRGPNGLQFTNMRDIYVYGADVIDIGNDGFKLASVDRATIVGTIASKLHHGNRQTRPSTSCNNSGNHYHVDGLQIYPGNVNDLTIEQSYFGKTLMLQVDGGGASNRRLRIANTWLAAEATASLCTTINTRVKSNAQPGARMDITLDSVSSYCLRDDPNGHLWTKGTRAGSLTINGDPISDADYRHGDAGYLSIHHGAPSWPPAPVTAWRSAHPYASWPCFLSKLSDFSALQAFCRR